MDKNSLTWLRRDNAETGWAFEDTAVSEGRLLAVNEIDCYTLKIDIHELLAWIVENRAWLLSRHVEAV
jgi:hypothetical protein